MAERNPRRKLDLGGGIFWVSESVHSQSKLRGKALALVVQSGCRGFFFIVLLPASYFNLMIPIQKYYYLLIIYLYISLYLTSCYLFISKPKKKTPRS